LRLLKAVGTPSPSTLRLRDYLKVTDTFLAMSQGLQTPKTVLNHDGAVLLPQAPYPPPCAPHALPEHTQAMQANATPEGPRRGRNPT
jgi:hypothetical protein